MEVRRKEEREVKEGKEALGFQGRVGLVTTEGREGG